MLVDERLESSPAAPSDSTGLLSLPKPKLAPIASCETLTDVTATLSSGESSPRHSASNDSRTSLSPTLITADQQQQQQPPPISTTTTTSHSRRLELPTTLDSLCISSIDQLSTAASSDTLVPGSPGRCDLPSATTPTQSSSLAALLLVSVRSSAAVGAGAGPKSRARSTSPLASHQLNALALSSVTSSKSTQSPLSTLRRLTSPPSSCDVTLSGARRATSPSPLHRSPVCSPKLHRASSPISYSYSSPNIITTLTKSRAACTYHVLLSLNSLALLH